jgi:hypothetical protein
MPSRKYFTPGRNSNASRLINYNAVMDAYSKKILCNCYQDQYKKFTSQAPSINTSRSQRISQVINNSVGGSTQFGNY